MPSNQIFFSVMFVGKYSCTSHVLQYSSSLSYEHSRSLQSFLCSGAVTVLICSFFVAALLFVYINFKNSGKIIHIFTNRQTFSYLFCIFSQFHPRKNWIFRIILVFLHPKASRAVIFGWTRQPSEQREQSQTCLGFAESRERKSISSTEQNVATVVSTMRKQH